MSKEAKRELINEEKVKKEKRVRSKEKRQSRLKIAQVITKKRLAIATVILMLIGLVGATMLTYKKANLSSYVDPELLRARTYGEFTDEDAKTEIDYVEFGAFFLRDLDGDGIAEKIKGTCKEIGQEDTLYMELKVLTNGYLENGKITISGDNFYLQTALPKDNEIKENTIGNNVKSISLNQIMSGTQKLLTGIVRSGEYGFYAGKANALRNNSNNYSTINKVVLSGTHVAIDGTETKINKEIELNVDWYGEAKTEISSYIAGSKNLNQTKNLQEVVDEENGNVVLDFTLGMQEIKSELLLKSANLSAELPILNGYYPTRVEVIGDNIEYSYDEATRILTIKKETVLDDSGIITANCYDGTYYDMRYNKFNLKITYPMESYTDAGEDMIELKMPAKAYYEGYNNANSEFSNPYKSAVESATYVIMFENPKGTAAKIEAYVGKYYDNKYFVSKKNPYNIYNGMDDIGDDIYTVRWVFITGTDGSTGKITMAETATDSDIKTSDVFIKSNSEEDSMENITTNVGIYFSNATNMLGDDGEIKVYNDETAELLVTFTKKEWEKYNSSNPYKYETPVKHIRIETSLAESGKALYVYNIKSLDDDYITENYTLEEFENLKYIKSTLVGYIDGAYLTTYKATANYEAPYSVASLYMNQSQISTQETIKNYKITVSTYANEEMNQSKWKNGSFLLKLPKDIIDMDITNVSVSNPVVKITNYELYESEENIFIKINTSNENAAIFDIVITGDISPDPRVATTSESIELYYINENEDSVLYRNSVNDTYDVNGDLNTEEKVGIAYASISLVSPNSLLTNQTATNYDDDNNITIAPKNAELVKDRREATVNIELKNNYSSTISEVTIIGRVPFAGNKFTINGRDMGSTYTATMKDSGIIVPEELLEYATIYYSENGEATKDINDESNGWTTNPNDFSDIKSYMISLGNYIFNKDDVYTINYDISIPNGLNYNDVAYSHHAVYFSLDTENGKFRTYIEPNRVGFMIAKQFDLEVIKYQKNKDKVVGGAIYSISEEGKDALKSRTTEEDGKLELAGLYIDRKYVLKEISSPIEYSLNEDEVKFTVSETNEGIKVTLLSGNPKTINAIQAVQGEDYRVRIEVEDEVKANLRILKTEDGTDTPIKNVRFKITGKGLPSKGKIITTNVNGEVSLKGLELNEEYSLEETKAEGYYLLSKTRFKILNNNGNYELQVLEGDINQNSFSENNGIPTLNIGLKNEKIPRYTLIVNKIEKGSTTPVVGAKFKLYKNNSEYGEYVTDIDGHIIIDNLYQHIPEKNVDSIYKLKETFAPEGYAKTSDISFSVKNENGELTLSSEQTADYHVEGNTVYLNIEDSPSFKLVKKDGETGELLPNVKFALYNVENGEVPATNSKGDIIGTKETIDGVEYYTVTTNENGEITEDLPEGLYKAVEVEAEEKYDIKNNEEYFGIGKSRENEKKLLTDWAINIGGLKDDYIRDAIKTSDGGYLIGGYFNSETIELDNGEELINPSPNKSSGFLIKYDANREIEWTKVIDCQYYKAVSKVLETSDGDYVITGGFSTNILELDNGISLINKSWSGRSDVYVIKYGVDGDVKWARSFGGYDYETVEGIIETSEGDYIVGGLYESTVNLSNDLILTVTGSSQDAYLIKYSKDGEIVDAKSISSSRHNSSPNKIINSENNTFTVFVWSSGKSLYDLGNGVIVDGESYQDTYAFMVRYNENMEAEKAFAFGSKCYINHAVQTKDGGYLIGGSFGGESLDFGNNVTISRYNSNTYLNGFIVKYDADLNAEWAKRIGGRWYDSVSFVNETADGKYLVGVNYKSDTIPLDNNITLYRHSYDSNYYSIALIEYSTNGKSLSAKTIGGNLNDEISSIIETSECNYLISGSFSSPVIDLDNSVLKNYDTESYWGSRDGMVIELKYDDIIDTSVEYAQAISGTSSEYIESTIETSDGGYLVGGYFNSRNINIGDYTINNRNTNNEGIVIKYDKDNNVEWSRTIGGDLDDYVKSVVETTDGGYLLSGYFNSATIDLGDNIILNNSSSTSTYEGMIVKLNSKGDIEWAKSISGNSNEYIYKIIESEDDGFVICGDFDSSVVNFENNTKLYSYGASDGFIVKYKSNGDIEWVRNIGSGQNDKLNTVIKTTDGGYLLGGCFYSNAIELENGIVLSNNNSPSTSDGMIIKLDANGNVSWAKDIGEEKNETVISIAETIDNEYVVTGNFASRKIELEDDIILNNFYYGSDYTDVFIVKYGNDGKTKYGKRIGGKYSDYVYSVEASLDGEYLLSGTFSAGTYPGNNLCLSSTSGVLIKYNNEKTEWVKEIGSSAQIKSVVETKDKNYLIGGYIYSNNKLGLNVSGNSDGFIAKIASQNNVLETEEIIVENYRKTFNITTEVRRIDDLKGGTISGEDETVYEVVKYGESNTKKIEMIPDNNYEILEVSINGEKIEFETEDDGSFIMPTIDNITENKHIVVTYTLKDNKITINKVDSVSAEPIEGANFEIKEVEGRTDPDNSVIGGLVNSRINYNTYKGTMYSRGSYYFVEENGRYIANNGRKYREANGGITGVQNSEALSYMGISLYNAKDTYVIEVDASISSESGGDFGYAILSTSYSISNYSSDPGLFMNISGNVNSQKFISQPIEGGKYYYLHFIYKKNGSVDYGDDELVINNINIYKTSDVKENYNDLRSGPYSMGQYYMRQENNKYIPTNSNINASNTKAISYFPINLTNYEGVFTVDVNASISSEENKDIGYAIISTSSNAPNLSLNDGVFMKISGEKSTQVYTSPGMEGGKYYYLFLIYDKNESIDYGNDKLIVDSVNVHKKPEIIYNFEQIDGKYKSTNQGEDGTISVSYIPIDLTEFSGKYSLIVNAEVSSQRGRDCGYAVVSGSDSAPSYNNSTGRFIYISGTQPAKDYSVVLQGGKMYYLHLGYYKDYSGSSDDDAFTINNIEIKLNDSELYKVEVETDSSGQAITQIPFGKYTITEIQAPKGYEVNTVPLEIDFTSEEGNQHEFTIENSKYARVTVHHYIKDTVERVAEDDVLEGKQGETYTTIPKLDLEEYELEENEDGEIVIPDNSTGEFTYDDIEVTYYYVKKRIPVVVHHYIEGTIIPVPLLDGSQSKDIVIKGEEGTEYTTNAIPNEELNEKYELIKIPDNAEGIYEYPNIEVIYYYSKRKFNIETSVEAHEEIDILGQVSFVKGGTITGENDEIYEKVRDGEDSVKEIKIIPDQGYEIRSIKVNGNSIKFIPNSHGIVILDKFFEVTENKNVIVEFQRIIGKVITHYYLENTEKRILSKKGNVIDDEVQQGDVGATYVTIVTSEAHEMYELAGTKGEVSGKIGEKDKEVIYYYRIKDVELTINKIDKETEEKLENATFKIEEIDTREQPENLITELNKYNLVEESYSINTYNYDSYGFASVNNKWMPVNSGKYWSLQSNNTTANSYIKFDSIPSGTYKAVVNAEISSEESSDYGYATLDRTVTTSSTSTKFINISGEVGARDYESTTFTYNGSGNPYVINFAYQKNGITIDGDDTFTINSVKLINTNTREELDMTNRMTRNNQFYFEKCEDKYISTSNRAYASNNSRAYFQISPSKSGKYLVVLNAESKIETDDYFYATLKENAPSTDIDDGKFIYLTGTNEAKNYQSGIIEYEKSGEPIFLTVNYIKDNTIGGPADGVAINSIKLYRIENPSGSNNVGAIYTSQNKKIANSVSYAVMPIDLRECSGNYKITINAEISSEEDKDYGYALISNSEALIDPLDSSPFIYLSGEHSAHDYTKIIPGGKMYYLHLGYKKDASGNSGQDRLVVNSVDIELSKEDLFSGEFTTNENGQVIIDVSYGKYKITELEVPEGYEKLKNPIEINLIESHETNLTIENSKTKRVIVHHYIKGTEEQVSDDEEIRGAIGEEYTTSPHLDLEKYELEKDENGEDILPTNKDDKMSHDDIEVTYYYVKKKGTVTVKHLMEGTENNITLIGGAEVEPIVIKDEIDEEYRTDSLGDERNILVTTPENATGTYIDGNIDVIYYYKLNEQKYKVEYYYNEEINEEKTDELDAVYGDEITEYEDKVEKGYKFDKVEGTPLTITENEETNLIKVYYVTDPKQTKDLKYTVEYYISGDIQNDDTDEVHQIVQELEPNTLEVQKDDINTEDKYVGYKLEKILINNSEEPLEELPDTVNNNDVIKIFYVLDDTKTREIKYTVKYYKDEELQEGDTQIVRKVVHILDGDTLDVNVEDINVTDKYEGYTFEKTVPARIPTIAVDGETIEVYYVKTKYPYTVEYFYNGIKDNTATETGEAHKDDIIEEYENKVKEGYEFEEVEGIPLTISDTEENVIKVYYLPIRNLTVQHIDKKSGEILETEEKHGKEGYTVTTSAKDIEEYMLVESPNKEEYTYREQDQVVKYYYTKIITGVLEKHLDLITGRPIEEDVFYEGYEGKHYETSTKEIEGYTISTNKELYQSIVRESPEFLSDAGYESLIDFFEGTGIVTTDNYVPENAEGEMEENLITVRYYYTPIIRLIVKYKDILTGTEIEENVDGELVDSTINRIGIMDDPYTTIAKTFENYLGISNKAFYRNYLTNHPEVLEEAEVETVDEYLEKENIDPKASYIPENSEGTYEITLNDDGTYSNEIYVTYYYGVEREVIVKYYDKTTGEEIGEETVIVGPDGDSYDLTDTGKEIEGYTLVEEPENPLGTYQEENEERDYYYAKNTKVNVKYMDKDTKELIDTRANHTIDGYVGKEYETEKKTFDNYEYKSDSKNTKGEMTEEPIEVIYYYSKKATPAPSVQTQTTETPQEQTTSTTPKTTTQKRTIINRIVNPKTGDMVPVVAYSTIAIVLLANIMLARHNKVKLEKVTRISRINKTLETNKVPKIEKEHKKKTWIKSEKPKRAK